MSPDMLTGLILAGGQARRMQGAAATSSTTLPPDREEKVPVPVVPGQTRPNSIDKGLLDWHGQPLAAHAHRVLTPYVQTMLVSANRAGQNYAAYGQVLADDPALGVDLGPLAGVERALAAAQTPWLLVLPVDVVNLPPSLVPDLLAAVHAVSSPIAYARTAERAHPLCMALHTRLAGSLRNYLKAGDRKVQLWQQQHQAVPVLFRGDDLFFNINTPQDLAYASQCWKS